MVRYYKLFDLLNRREMKKTDLRKILSTKTIAKLSKGDYLSGEVVEKICLFLNCQPGDIMEIVEMEDISNDGGLPPGINANKDFITTKAKAVKGHEELSEIEMYGERSLFPNIEESDEEGMTDRQHISTSVIENK